MEGQRHRHSLKSSGASAGAVTARTVHVRIDQAGDQHVIPNVEEDPGVGRGENPRTRRGVRSSAAQSIICANRSPTCGPNIRTEPLDGDDVSPDHADGPCKRFPVSGVYAL